jgi:hypothetical protein
MEPLEYDQNPSQRPMRRILLQACLPVAVAYSACAFLAVASSRNFGALMLVPVALLSCAIWAGRQCRVLSTELAGRFSRVSAWMIRRTIFVLQAVGILSSWPAGVLFLRVVKSMGFRI